jgi:hypothetical protein
VAGQIKQFTATVNNTSNTAVVWSINPELGSISDGKYRSERGIRKSQTVTVTATSVADPTKSASAVITVVPSRSPTPRRPRE